MIKLVLPVMAVIGMAAVVISIYGPRVVPTVNVDIANTAITDGKLVMANPKLDGFTPDKRAYTVTATRATQDLESNGAIELEGLRASVEMASGETAVLVSEIGNYDSNANTLALPTESRMEMTDGTVAEMARADINMASGAVDAYDKVMISRQGTRITSQIMKVMDNGKHVIFEKDVRLVMQPKRVDKVTQSAEPQGVQKTSQ